MTTVSLQVPSNLVEELARRVAELVEPARCPSRGYLSVEEAAAYLACDRDRIYDLKSMGRLKHAKDGRRLLFRREWLDEALEFEV